MRTAIILSASVLLGLAPQDTPSRRDFEAETLGQLPQGWKAAQTGEGEGSRWVVTEDSSAPQGPKVLTQTAEAPRNVFNLCVVEHSSLKDVEVSVAFKALSGKVDQGGGVMWRYQDANNYYIARMNPLEDNLRIYYVIAGKRKQLASAEGLDVKVGQWHTLRIEHRGPKEEIECYLDGKKVLGVDKETTIAKPGKVGLWTKADARTAFDDFQVRGK